MKRVAPCRTSPAKEEAVKAHDLSATIKSMAIAASAVIAPGSLPPRTLGLQAAETFAAHDSYELRDRTALLMQPPFRPVLGSHIFGTLMFRKQTNRTQSGGRPRLAVVVAMCALPVLVWIIISLISGRVIWF